MSSGPRSMEYPDYCDVSNCAARPVVSINFNGCKFYSYCARHNHLKGKVWVVASGWAKSKEGKRYWKEESFHPQQIAKL